MSYVVKGRAAIGPLSYVIEELWDAAYTAAKMSDNGVEDVAVYDETGRKVDISNAPLPPGWKRGPPPR